VLALQSLLINVLLLLLWWQGLFLLLLLLSWCGNRLLRLQRLLLLLLLLLLWLVLLVVMLHPCWQLWLALIAVRLRHCLLQLHLLLLSLLLLLVIWKAADIGLLKAELQTVCSCCCWSFLLPRVCWLGILICKLRYWRVGSCLPSSILLLLLRGLAGALHAAAMHYVWSALQHR
jgi:hypothetical protein